MYPSQNPLLYIIHTVGILLIIALCLWFGLQTNQPLALLSVLALSYLPEWPLVQNMNDDDDEDPGYDGGSKFGFTNSTGPASRECGEKHQGIR